MLTTTIRKIHHFYLIRVKIPSFILKYLKSFKNSIEITTPQQTIAMNMLNGKPNELRT